MSKYIIWGSILFLLCSCKDDKKRNIYSPDDPTHSTDTPTFFDTGFDTSSSTHSEIDIDTNRTDTGWDTGTTFDTDADSADTAVAEGPLVTIVRPVATSLANVTSDRVIALPQIEVQCQVIPNPATQTPVDVRSVEIEIFNDAMSQSVIGTPNLQLNEYTGVIHVGDFENGAVSIGCTAYDLAPTPHATTTLISTFVDHGPEIVILSPDDNAAHGDVLNLQFMVAAGPLAADDIMAAPALNTVQVQLAGVNITSLIAPLPELPNVFNGVIYFDDPIFDSAINGLNTIRISARNSRPPQGVEKETTVSFIADGQGPTISPVYPQSGDLIGGQINIIAAITDASGVAPQSIVATVAGIHEIKLEKNADNSDLYSGFFDSRQLAPTMIYPNITIRALDTLGNQSSHGYIVTLDNSPPLLSLDPPSVREAARAVFSGKTECSWLFDPLGGWDPAGMDPDFGDAVDDGESVSQLFDVRARLEDRGNNLRTMSGIDVPSAGVAPESVTLYILDDENDALIVDANGDGVCDSINPGLIPASLPETKEAIVIQLQGLSPAGIANFTPLPEPTMAQPPFDTDPAHPETICSEGSAEKNAVPICASSPTTRIIPSVAGEPAIYAVPPTGGDRCMGTPIDAVANQLADGWVCIAVAAADILGNVGISAPLRVCIDHDQDGAECPPTGTVQTEGLPQCTGTLNPQNDTVDPTLPCLLKDDSTPSSPITARPFSWYFEDYPEYQLIFR